MNAKETKIKGIQYCKNRAEDNPYCPCSGCPFENKIMCIDEYGELAIHHGKDDPDFEDFARDFTFMIEELYKDGNVN